ncbi:MAG: serine hydrolase [Sandaracinaceae bacterium]
MSEPGRRVAILALWGLLTACSSAPNAPADPTPREPRSVPEETGPEPPPEVAEAAPPVPVIRLAAEDEDALDALMSRHLEAGAAPGAVVVLGRGDGVVFRRAYGRRAIDPEVERMSVDTVFDLASVTKAVATATSVMRLVQEGRLDLDEDVRAHLPPLWAGVTARHLLTHTSGLPAVNALRDYDMDDRAASVRRILRTPLEQAPGGHVRYSDLNFIVLGELVHRLSGQPLDAFAARHVFDPLGMRDTGFRPPAGQLPRIAPTERAVRRGDVMIRGVVHDPRAYRLGGLAGNAGLFSTGDDLARFAEAMLAGGEPVLTRETLTAMTAPSPLTRGRRALGWDLGRAPMSGRAFGHGGYTGTSFWIDPGTDLYVILLTNRVHPDGGGDISALGRELTALAVDAAPRMHTHTASTVLTGVDVFVRDGPGTLGGAHVALLTHRAARTRDGRRTLDVLHAHPGVDLVRVWAPEHGLASAREGHVRDHFDAATGLPVHSLFGRTRVPTDAMLEGVDTVVVDLQDVGVRFYTYAATVRRVLEVAAERHLRVVILDRPDALGGGRPRGPVSTEAQRSFVNHHPLPAVHGLTLGELSGYLNQARGIDAALEVVRVEGWRRGDDAADTGLRWVPSSPNLRTPAQVRLYPALGLLEGTNVSVGRGTEHPFEVLGAPFIDGVELARALGEVPGVIITPTRFTPRASRHRKQACAGVRLEVRDRDGFDPMRLGFGLAIALRRLYPNEWDADAMLRMVGRADVHRQLMEGGSYAELESLWRTGLDAFAADRRAALLY